MTEIVMFVFDYIYKFLYLLKTFEFELFGVQTNMLYIILSFLIITICVSFLRLGMNITTTEVMKESINHRMKFNRLNNAYVPKHSYQPKHIKGSSSSYLTDKGSVYQPKHSFISSFDYFPIHNSSDNNSSDYKPRHSSNFIKNLKAKNESSKR